jgi:hypothetical protein
MLSNKSLIDSDCSGRTPFVYFLEGLGAPEARFLKFSYKGLTKMIGQAVIFTITVLLIMTRKLSLLFRLRKVKIFLGVSKKSRTKNIVGQNAFKVTLLLRK